MSKLLEALQAGDVADVKRQLASGPDLAEPLSTKGKKGSGMPALAWACLGKHTDIVAALLDAGAPLGLVDDRPMLHFAVFHAWRQQKTVGRRCASP